VGVVLEVQMKIGSVSLYHELINEDHGFEFQSTSYMLRDSSIGVCTGEEGLINKG